MSAHEGGTAGRKLRSPSGELYMNGAQNGQEFYGELSLKELITCHKGRFTWRTFIKNVVHFLMQHYPSGCVALGL